MEMPRQADGGTKTAHLARKEYTVGGILAYEENSGSFGTVEVT